MKPPTVLHFCSDLGGFFTEIDTAKNGSLHSSPSHASIYSDGRGHGPVEEQEDWERDKETREEGR